MILIDLMDLSTGYFKQKSIEMKFDRLNCFRTTVKSIVLSFSGGENNQTRLNSPILRTFLLHSKIIMTKHEFDTVQAGDN